MWMSKDKDEDWTEKFIRTIQSKPALYNRNLKDNSDKNLVAKLWTEVCEVMVESWDEMNEEQKIIKGKELQHRWRNLRTCFKRELNKQKDGKYPKKRRKYIYFNQLLFLLPTIDDIDTTNETNSSLIYMDVSENEEDHVDETTYHPRECNPPPVEKPKKETFEELLIQTLKDKKEEKIDEDKLFLLSLIPSFKKMNGAQKIEAKMDFLGTIQRILHPI